MKTKTPISAMCEPARRHRCEICTEVFECHLCTLRKDHVFHGGIRITNIEDMTIPVFVCEECAVTDNCRMVESALSRTRALMVPYYDYLTGKTIMAQNKRLADIPEQFLSERQKAGRAKNT